MSNARNRFRQWVPRRVSVLPYPRAKESGDA